MIHKDIIYCANAGDSRCILWENTRHIVELSTDHKPENSIERQRIQKAGGFVSYGRTCGNLSLSRALGDFDYKSNPNISLENQIITALPDIRIRQISASDDFLVLGCDGIWEILAMDQICHIANQGLNKGLMISRIAEQILDKGTGPNRSYGKGCDNMTCIIIQLNP